MKPQPNWIKIEVLLHVTTHRLIHDLAREQQISIPELIKRAIEDYQPPTIEMGPDTKPSYSPYIVHETTMKWKSLDDMAHCQQQHQQNSPEPAPVPVPVPQKKHAA